jgi:hypothetical protein
MGNVRKLAEEDARLVKDQRELTEFKEKLEDLLNRTGMDTFCNTPDFILAEHLTEQLRTFAVSMRERDGWMR